MPRTFLCFGITDMKLCDLHFGELCTCGGAAIAFPLGKVARRCALALHRDG